MEADEARGLAIGILVIAMMLALGMKLTLGEIWMIRHRLPVLGWLLVANLIAIPAVGYATCVGFSLTPEVSIALLLCAATPGGPMGPLYANTAKADLAFAIAVMVILAAICTITAPVTLLILLSTATPNDIGHTVVALTHTLLVFQLLPLLVGLATRRAWPGLALRLAPPLTRFANLLLALVVVALVIAKGHLLLTMAWPVVTAMLALIAACLLLGGILPRHDRDTARAGALVTVVRNLALALLLGTSHFPAPETDAAILMFGLFMLTIPAVAAQFWKRRPAI